MSQINTYLVMYDLNGKEPRSSYLQLALAIMAQGKTEKVQYSTWILISGKTEVQIRDSLAHLIDFNDSLIVVRIDAYATQGIPLDKMNLVRNAWIAALPRAY